MTQPLHLFFATPRCRAVLALTTLLAGPVLAIDVVVGPGNCNEAGFSAALTQVQNSGGGTVSFACGAVPVTIPITAYHQISTAVIIDGGDRISFDGNHAASFFQVFANASLDLRRLILRRGHFNGANVLENFGQLRLRQVQVRENTSSALVNYGTATIESSVFHDNDASMLGQSGAAIVNDGGSVLILDSTFTNNVIVTTIGTGGAIAAVSGPLIIRRSSFVGNYAPDGGVIYLGTGASAEIERSWFNGNSAGYGGAIETWGNDVRITDSRFQNNQALIGDGGAIWVLAGHLTVVSSQFTSNQAATTGGALSCYDDILTIAGSTFVGNQSGSDGGAVFSSCGFLVSNSTFHDNAALGPASGGGAIHHSGSMFGGVFFSTLTDNTAGFGAGVASQSATTSAHIFASLLTGNVGGNCAGVLTSGGYNLSSDSHCGGAFTAVGDLNMAPVPLQPLADYGGPTWTRPPQAGNAGIDRVPPGDCPALYRIDQRGAIRPVNGACDSGAYEVGGDIDKIFADSFQ